DPVPVAGGHRVDVFLALERASARRRSCVLYRPLGRLPRHGSPAAGRMITGILLAAGAGTRFGGRKLLHPLPDGVPVGIAALRNLASAVASVVVVVRPGDHDLRTLLASEGASVVECKDAAQGMGHSLAAGVAESSTADGWVIALGDMPRI